MTYESGQSDRFNAVTRSSKMNGSRNGTSPQATLHGVAVVQASDRYRELTSFFKPVIFDRGITTSFPHRWHLMTNPWGSIRAVIRPQIHRTSLPDAGISVLFMSISPGTNGHRPSLTMTFQIDKTSPPIMIRRSSARSASDEAGVTPSSTSSPGNKANARSRNFLCGAVGPFIMPARPNRSTQDCRCTRLFLNSGK